MASRFWVGGSGTWDNTTTHWSASSGGASGASVPTSSDAVTFDANSGANAVVTIGGAAVCASLTTTNFVGQFAYTFTPTTSSLQIFGNITIGASHTFTGSNADARFYFKATSGGPYTFTSNGVDVVSFAIAASAAISLQLGDNVSISGQLLIEQGTFNANNKNVTCFNVAYITQGVATVLTMGSGTWTLTGTGTVWSFATTTNLTLNANTSTIALTGSSATFAGGGKTYSTIDFATGTYTISGSNTFGTMSNVGGVGTVIFTAGTTQTVTTFSLAGTDGQHKETLQSSSGGSAWNLSIASGAVAAKYLSLQDSAAAGGATFSALWSTNVSGNSGWNFVGSGLMGLFD